MVEHFLVKKAHIYEKKDIIEPEEFLYDDLIGLWVCNENKEILVKSNHPNRPVQMTKKLNQENTEDQK